jgi:hypothetical protein
MDETETIKIGNRIRKLGCVAPSKGFVSARPVFGDHIETMSRTELEKWARNSTRNGRTRFGKNFIFDQGRAGSCNGWMGTGMLMRARARSGMPYVELAGNYVYSLINGGRDNGSMLDAGMEVLQENGAATIATVGPADRIYRKQYNTAAADKEAKKYRGFECYRLTTIEEFFTALALQWDCGCVVEVGRNFDNIDSYGIPGVDRGNGNHAVGADDLIWSRNQLAADAYSSWGTRYADGGRIILIEAHLERTIDIHSFYAMRSAMDDAAPPKPRR